MKNTATRFDPPALRPAATRLRTTRRSLAVMAACVVLFSLVAPGQIFADAYSNLVKVTPVLVTSVTGNGDPVKYPVTDNGEITVAEVLIGQGAETGWHTHASPVYAYVLAGTLTVDYADGTGRIFQTGDAIIEVVNTPHNGRCTGAETVRLIVFYTGIKGRPNSEKIILPAK